MSTTAWSPCLRVPAFVRGMTPIATGSSPSTTALRTAGSMRTAPPCANEWITSAMISRPQSRSSPRSDVRAGRGIGRGHVGRSRHGARASTSSMEMHSALCARANGRSSSEARVAARQHPERHGAAGAGHSARAVMPSCRRAVMRSKIASRDPPLVLRCHAFEDRNSRTGVNLPHKAEAGLGEECDVLLLRPLFTAQEG